MRPLPWLLVAIVALAACSERSQGEPARLKKTDTGPSAGTVAADKAYMASGWTPGDDPSWQTQIRTRTQGQNEYTRVTAVPSAPSQAKAP